MDDRQFDRIGKWLASPENRRSTLRGISAGALAITLGRIDPDGAVADQKKPGKKPIGARCKNAKECKQGLHCQKSPDENLDWAKRCCRAVDDACADDLDCCGMLVCNNNICTID